MSDGTDFQAPTPSLTTSFAVPLTHISLMQNQEEYFACHCDRAELSNCKHWRTSGTSQDGPQRAAGTISFTGCEPQQLSNVCNIWFSTIWASPDKAQINFGTCTKYNHLVHCVIKLSFVTSLGYLCFEMVNKVDIPSYRNFLDWQELWEFHTGFPLNYIIYKALSLNSYNSSCNIQQSLYGFVVFSVNN